jgi:hypothetical protein
LIIIKFNVHEKISLKKRRSIYYKIYSPHHNLFNYLEHCIENWELGTASVFFLKGRVGRVWDGQDGQGGGYDVGCGRLLKTTLIALLRRRCCCTAQLLLSLPVLLSFFPFPPWLARSLVFAFMCVVFFLLNHTEHVVITVCSGFFFPAPDRFLVMYRLLTV